MSQQKPIYDISHSTFVYRCFVRRRLPDWEEGNCGRSAREQNGLRPFMAALDRLVRSLLRSIGVR